MIYKLTIPGKLPGWNQMQRMHWANYRRKKAETEQFIIWYIIQQLRRVRIKAKVRISITFYEPDCRRDEDNIISGQKFIMDALVKRQVIKNDSQRWVSLGRHTVKLDKGNPRVEVTIEELKT